MFANIEFSHDTYTQCHVGCVIILIVKCEHISNFDLIANFEQTNNCCFRLKRQVSQW